ncbi:MAG TPA: hypothetical protein VF121_09295 [Thermoanaerobaculia bacterium]|nr:hypothetical protein [Thermoanaerobaculia bacterium]
MTRGARGVHRAALLAAALLIAAAPAPRSSDPALRLEAGSVARRQLVAVGRDLVVEGRALGDVAALQGSVAVSGSVAGDVIVLSGDARLGPTARVGGDVFVVGGSIHAAPGARIEGRGVSYPTASSAWLTLVEGPSLGLPAHSPLILGAKLALLAAWAALLMLFFATAGRQVLGTAASVRREPFRGFFVGLVGIVAMLLTALFFSAFAGAFLALPLLALVVLLAVLLKLWGMVAVFCALGDWTARRLFRRARPRPINAATLGLLLLGALKFLPLVGVWAWTAATLIGVGATLTTKFGRYEPWFELSAAEG